MWSGWQTSTCWLMSSARKWLLSSGPRLTGSGATYSSCTRARLRGARNSACMAPGLAGTGSHRSPPLADSVFKRWFHSFENSLVGFVLLRDAAVLPDLFPYPCFCMCWYSVVYLVTLLILGRMKLWVKVSLLRERRPSAARTLLMN
ncbi:hypothetical protein EYF80_064731 [Liparis tanakae]|uniref:Uncharacterized protein n=1 Tax=Liparis tanakae TaxID=230148 RepID=A0A4Z2EA47_9TELE|nr:hypothetical protein EYF80_064731 [Liparis tanakae]